MFSDPSGLRKRAPHHSDYNDDSGETAALGGGYGGSAPWSPYDREEHWAAAYGFDLFGGGGGGGGGLDDEQMAIFNSVFTNTGGGRTPRSGLWKFFNNLFGKNKNSGHSGYRIAGDGFGGNYNAILAIAQGGNIGNQEPTPNLHLNNLFGDTPPTLESMLTSGGYSVNSPVPKTKAGVTKLINDIPQLKKFYEAATSPNIFTPKPNDSSENTNYVYYIQDIKIHGISLMANAFHKKNGKTSILVLISTLFHEIYHSYQNNVAQSALGGLTISQYTNKYYKGADTYMEAQAYYFELFLGNTDPRVRKLYNSKLNFYLNYEE